MPLCDSTKNAAMTAENSPACVKGRHQCDTKTDELSILTTTRSVSISALALFTLALSSVLTMPWIVDQELDSRDLEKR